MQMSGLQCGSASIVPAPPALYRRRPSGSSLGPKGGSCYPPRDSPSVSFPWHVSETPSTLPGYPPGERRDGGPETDPGSHARTRLGFAILIPPWEAGQHPSRIPPKNRDSNCHCEHPKGLATTLGVGLPRTLLPHSSQP